MKHFSLLSESKKIGRAILLGLCVFFLVLFFTKIEKHYSRMILLYFNGINVVLMFTARWLLKKWLFHVHSKGVNAQKVLFLGAGPLARRVIDVLGSNALFGYRVVGFLDNRHKIGTTYQSIRVLGSLSELEATIEQYKVNYVFIALDWRYYTRIFDLLNTLKEHHVSVMVVPDIYQYSMLLHSTVEDINGIPIIKLTDSPMYGWSKWMKRVFDIIFSLSVFMLFFPLLVLIGLLVKLTSKGPVLYRQERTGMDGKLFQIMKFRTMVYNAEKNTGPKWAEPNEKRMTWIGRYLRRTSLDELPQFLNVLKGEMSVVGPRPERPFFIRKFKKHVPKYMLRHKMKAGITGWAQINGLRGNTSIQSRIDYDVYYIENWSLLFDIKIIVLTVYRMLWDKNAY